MKKFEDKTIDDVHFLIGQLPAMRATLLFNRLVRLIGPAFGKAFAGVSVNPKGGNKISLGDVDVGKFGDALGLLFTAMPEAEFKSVLGELFSNTQVYVADQRVAPVMDAFDIVFAGKIATVYKLAAAAIGVNFQDFIGELGAIVRKQQIAATPPAASSSETSPSASPSSGPVGG
jgi:hypothetical protein